MSSGTRWDQIKNAERHGTGAQGQASDGTGASGNLPKFNADGSLTDSSIPAANVALISSVQQEAYVYAADTGTANAYAVTLSPAPTIVAGSEVVFKAANANTGASTLTVNGGAATAIKKWSSGILVDLASGDIAANQIVTLKFDGTNWQWTGGDTSNGGMPALSFAPRARYFNVLGDTVSYGSPDALRIAGDLAIGMWIKLPPNANGCLVRYGVGATLDPTTAWPYFISLAGASGAWSIIVGHDATSNINNHMSPFAANIPNNVWCYLGISRDTTALTYTLYKGDGTNIVQVGVFAYSDNPPSTAGTAAGSVCTLSAPDYRSDLDIEHLVGYIEEHYIANIAWSMSDHQAAMNSKPPTSGLQLAVAMGSTPEVDTSSNAFTGAVSGTTLVIGRDTDLTLNANAATVTNTSGNLISGQLLVGNGGADIKTGDLSGDVTTSGSTATTLASSGVTAGSYTNPNITVDAKGRVTAAANGSTTRQGFISYYLSGQPAASASCFVDIPGNLSTFQIPGNFSGASGKPGANPTATAVFTFYKTGSSFGTLSISTSGAYTWSTSGGTAVSFTPGTDELSWTAPGTQDATLSDVRFGIPVSIS